MAAPSGNLFALGNSGGRPPKYKNSEDLFNKCNEYFETTKNSSGKYQPTIEGLTLYLGFHDRRSLIDYAEKEEFTHVIGRAKGFIKSCYEKNLYGFAWAGASFALRNLGKKDWQDEVKQTVDSTQMVHTITEKKRED